MSDNLKAENADLRNDLARARARVAELDEAWNKQAGEMITDRNKEIEGILGEFAMGTDGDDGDVNTALCVLVDDYKALKAAATAINVDRWKNKYYDMVAYRHDWREKALARAKEVKRLVTMLEDKVRYCPPDCDANAGNEKCSRFGIVIYTCGGYQRKKDVKAEKPAPCRHVNVIPGEDQDMCDDCHAIIRHEKPASNCKSITGEACIHPELLPSCTNCERDERVPAPKSPLDGAWPYCPKCNSHDTTGFVVTYNDGSAKIKNHCNDCTWQWFDKAEKPVARLAKPGEQPGPGETAFVVKETGPEVKLVADDFPTEPATVTCPDCGRAVVVPVVNRRVQCTCGIWIAYPGFTGPWVEGEPPARRNRSYEDKANELDPPRQKLVGINPAVRFENGQLPAKPLAPWKRYPPKKSYTYPVRQDGDIIWRGAMEPPGCFGHYPATDKTICDDDCPHVEDCEIETPEPMKEETWNHECK
jgi:hypothetical protein